MYVSDASIERKCRKANARLIFFGQQNFKPAGIFFSACWRHLVSSFNSVQSWWSAFGISRIDALVSFVLMELAVLRVPFREHHAATAHSLSLATARAVMPLLANASAIVKAVLNAAFVAHVIPR